MMSQRKMYLSALLALVIVTVASSYDCPEDCQCMVINGATPHNHAKCTSLKGLIESKNLPIHSIDLSNISLTRIPSHQLEKLRDLTEIDLSHNELAEVGRLGRRVKSLNLKNNRITSGKLSKIPLHVQHLDLSYNELTYLPLEIRNLSKLRTIELTNNQINCSCETLDVRNWLQEKHVYTENVVKCTYPAEVKGKPWLQVKQSEICDHEKAFPYFEDKEDNELMMGDQPMNDASAEENGEEELGKDFMPIDKKISSTEANPMDDVEGSGDLSVRNMPMSLTSQESTNSTENLKEVIDEDDDGSGSGMGPIIFLPNTEKNEDETEEKTEDEESNAPLTFNSTDVFGAGLGIANFNDSKEADEEVFEEPIVRTDFKEVEESPESTENEAVSDGNDTEMASIMVPNSENGESKNTYILLGVILLIVLGLVLYVGVKRCRSNSRNRSSDAENQRATELLNMDKKNLGKPIQKNGTEHAPLITDKKKEEIVKPANGNSRTIYENEKDNKVHEPLLNGDTKPQNESNNNIIPTEQPIQPTVQQPVHADPPYDPNHRIIPRYPPPKSPRASKQNYENNADPYLPSSPKMGRYSPVYSPETGKVKIKLTETPKPKTPMLVTRSKSNAGDIITTPVSAAAAIQNDVGVHQRTGPSQALETPPQQLQEQQQH